MIKSRVSELFRQGYAMRQRLACFPFLLLLVGCGTRAAVPAPPAVEAPTPLGVNFNPARAGTIEGRVSWQGDMPTWHAYRDVKTTVGREVDSIDFLNPAIPKIHAENRGIGQTLVFLRSVDPKRSKPWDIPAPKALAHNNLMHLEQFGRLSPVGIARRGDEIELSSTNTELDLLRAEGAAFFTLAFPVERRPLARVMDRAGVVEFSSAVGKYWAKAWLMVLEHPYAAITDDEGRFSLSDVPDGDYELVLWMPNPHVERFERDPELLRVSRVWHGPALEKSVRVTVKAKERTETGLCIGAGDFKRQGANAPRSP